METRDSLDGTLSALRRYRVAVERYLARRGRELGLHSTDISALAHIADYAAHSTPMSPGELGHLLALSCPATTAVLDRLERAGYIERRRDDHDGRRLHILPTASGAEEPDVSYGAFYQSMRAALEPFTPDERALFAKMMTAIALHVDDEAPCEGPATRRGRP